MSFAAETQDQEQPDAPDRWSRLTAERDRYREALERLASMTEVTSADGEWEAPAYGSKTRRIALDALRND